MPKIAFYQPDIAGNVGSMIRTAACLGVEMHIIEPCGFVFDMNKIKRSALDYNDLCEIIRHDSFEEFYQKMIIENKSENGRLILLTTKASRSYTEFKFEENDILLLGRESAGVPEEVANLADEKIKIAMQNNRRSLNVTIAASMILGEAIRQVK